MKFHKNTNIPRFFNILNTDDF